MPTYDYHCEACGREFEEFHKISDPPVQKCTLCGGGPVRKLVSGGAGIHFKGSGFYVTDYKNSASGSGESSGSQAGSSEK